MGLFNDSLAIVCTNKSSLLLQFYDHRKPHSLERKTPKTESRESAIGYVAGSIHDFTLVIFALRRVPEAFLPDQQPTT